MKVLFISNYSPYEKVMRGVMPSQHLFGFKELDDPNIDVDYVKIPPKKGGIKDLVKEFYYALKFSHKHYDVIFDSLASLDRGMGLLKAYGLTKQKYIVVMHHPPFEQRLERCKYDAAMFLDKVAYDEMVSKYPQKASMMYQNTWGPDLQFYDSILTKYNYELANPLVFISNGKTNRDNELLVAASEEIDKKVIIVCDEEHKPSNYRSQSNVKLYLQDRPDDIKQVKLLQTSAVMVIPTLPSEKRIGCIGNTSFQDAIAIGMPVIVADNSVMSDIVIAHKCGFVYKAGSKQSLIEKMKMFVEEPALVHKMGYNARKYAEQVNMKEYSAKVKQVIYKVYQKK